ncbi:MAG: hypothetical protein GTO71_04740 [Woeseiaceae bacterium]|nr:hypothetical protein [Woeseiaceae bacterium]NIP20405.1 hypothetical protein [Woeseiaceae bacterium]NIS89294.1 hypothetical protein [Woeseiaceae bacterium]
MHDIDLSRLRSRLLRWGVAPRHVRRTVAELKDHFDDLVEQGLSDGADRLTACEDARAMLGNLDDIANAVRAQPELRSWAFRYPRVAAVIYPLTFLAMLPAAPVFIGYAHAGYIARWLACLLLSGLVTASMFLVLQLAITLS